MLGSAVLHDTAVSRAARVFDFDVMVSKLGPVSSHSSIERHAESCQQLSAKAVPHTPLS